MSALRVLVVENDGERRLADAIANDRSMELAAVAGSGRQAIALARGLRPDAVVMATNVGGIDAFAATREIMTVAPTPIVLIFDEVGSGAERARTRAAEAGALAAVPFPAHSSELIDLVAAMAAVGVVRRRPERDVRAPARTHVAVAPRQRRRTSMVVAIGASTGGPAALRSIFTTIPADFEAPILVTQHISSGFSDGMVSWLNSAGSLRAKIAEDGEPLRNGTIYVAPDDRHLTVSADYAVAISEAPPAGGHRPSATIMFRSAAERFGAGTLAIVLSGMGRDGVEGLGDVHRAGGIIYAQDEATCAVFGMPKAAIDAGLADFVLPLDAISRHIADAVASS